MRTILQHHCYAVRSSGWSDRVLSGSLGGLDGTRVTTRTHVVSLVDNIKTEMNSACSLEWVGFPHCTDVKSSCQRCWKAVGE